MTHWYWWIPTHASKSRQKQRQLAPPKKNAASCAQRKPSRQSDLYLTCSIQKLFILPRLHAPMRSKVAAYSAMHDSQESSLCALESVIVLALSCTVDTQCDGPDCTQWTSAEVQVGSEPQALSATNATGLGLVLSLGNLSQREMLVHRGMEKGRRSHTSGNQRRHVLCQVLPQRSCRNSFP